MVLVDFRAIVRNMEVRVAGAPSYYPSVFIFRSDFRPGMERPQMVPPEAILGFHGFDSNSLEMVSHAGATYESVGPDLWYWGSATFLPVIWAECERRVLRLPRKRRRESRPMPFLQDRKFPILPYAHLSLKLSIEVKLVNTQTS